MPNRREFKSTSPTPVSSLGQTKQGGLATLQRTLREAKYVYDALPSREEFRKAFTRLTRSVGTVKVPDPPPVPQDQVGPRESTLHPSLVATPGADGKTIGYAPSAVSETMSRFAEVAGNDRAMRVRFRQPLTHFGTESGPGGTAPMPGFLNYVATSSSGVTAAPQSCSVLSINPLRMEFLTQRTATTYSQGMAYADGLTVSDIALGFSMWRCCGPLRFYYEPQSSSATDARIDFAFTDDGAHPVLGLSNASASCPTVVQIDATATSVGFSPWNAWEMVVNPDTTWKYSYVTPHYASAVVSSSLVFSLSNTRMSSCGAISSVVSNVGSVGSVFGRLLIEGEFEFKDPAPLAALSPFLSISRIERCLASYYEGEEESKTPASSSSTLTAPVDATPPTGSPSMLAPSTSTSSSPAPTLLLAPRTFLSR